MLVSLRYLELCIFKTPVQVGGIQLRFLGVREHDLTFTLTSLESFTTNVPISVLQLQPYFDRSGYDYFFCWVSSGQSPDHFHWSPFTFIGNPIMGPRLVQPWTVDNRGHPFHDLDEADGTYRSWVSNSRQFPHIQEFPRGTGA
jgi:hypothetical protein